MKNFLIRLAAYIPIITFFWLIFVPRFFDPLPMQGNFFQRAPGYIVFYGITYGFWIFIYEAVYHAAKSLRKPKPVPETQPLSAVEEDKPSNPNELFHNRPTNRGKQALTAKVMAEWEEQENRNK